MDDEYESRFTAFEYAMKHLDKMDDLEYTLEDTGGYDADDPVAAVENQIRQAVDEGSNLDRKTTDALLDVLESAYMKAVHSKDAEQQLAGMEEKRREENTETSAGDRYRLRERVAGDDASKKAADAERKREQYTDQEHEYQQDMGAILDMVGVVSAVSDVSREAFLTRVGEHTEITQQGYNAETSSK